MWQRQSCTKIVYQVPVLITRLRHKLSMLTHTDPHNPSEKTECPRPMCKLLFTVFIIGCLGVSETLWLRSLVGGLIGDAHILVNKCGFWQISKDGKGVVGSASKWPSAITRLTAHCACGLMCDLVICKHDIGKSMVIHTLPRQWSLITISQDNHSFHPMFPTDHCRLVSIFRRKVRWRSEHVYTRITDTCRLT